MLGLKKVKKMGSCDFCKKVPTGTDQLKTCVCKKASYCSKDCQEKDWKTHKPSCPPFIIRESPGKGRGLFATRKIKEGQVIMEEYPLLVLRDGTTLPGFQANHFPNIDEEVKAKILQLNDPADDFKKLDTGTVEELIRKEPSLKFWKEARSDEMSKVYRIFCGNSIRICVDQKLYRNIAECGLYYNIHLINHSCVPNTTTSWVMGDFRRKQVRAIKVIEKNQEILLNYQNGHKRNYECREIRRQTLLETRGFLCECLECSLEGEDLVENERIRAEIREKTEKIEQLIRVGASNLVPRSHVKKTMKSSQQLVKLTQKLNIRAGVVPAMIDFYHFALMARGMNIACENEPDTFKQEALKYAKMFGDDHIYLCYKCFNN